MPRTKGSKNKKSFNPETVEQVLAQKTAQSNRLAQDIKTLEEALEECKTSIKDKKAQLRNIEKDILKLQVEKEAAAKIEAQKADKVALDNLVKDLIKKGVSPKELIEKIKG